MGSRKRRAARWLARIAFGVSLLALLGTSPPRWQVNPPNDVKVPAPPSGMALRLALEASQGPEVRYQNRLGAETHASWLATIREPVKESVLLPPGAALRGVSIDGRCSGGCSDKCVPPADAFVRVAVEPVQVWTQIERSETTVTLYPIAPNDPRGYRRFEVLVDALPRSVEVVLSAATPADRSGWTGTPATALCNVTRPSDAGGEGPGTTCVFYPSHPKTPTELHVTAAARSFGECSDAKIPCSAPPSAKPPRIVSVALVP